VSAAVPGKPLLSVRQAAQRLGVSETTAYEWARRNELPGLVRLGGRLYVRAVVLDRFIAGDDVPTAPDGVVAAVRQVRPTNGA
jgi:excisionase family DNA binding protein